MSEHPYPHLNELIGGWFHQDFDLAGETLEEILSSYRNGSSPEHRAATSAEISRLLDDESIDLDRDFQPLFEPGVLPAQWSLTTRDWLLRLRELIF